MPTCVNDFNPLILAVAGLITVQFPVIVALLVNQQKLRNDVIIAKDPSLANVKRKGLQRLRIGKRVKPDTSVLPPSDIEKL